MAAIWRSQAAVGSTPPLNAGLVVSPFGSNSTGVAPRVVPRGQSGSIVRSGESCGLRSRLALRAS